MKLKQAVFMLGISICCSPTSIGNNILIGKWANSAIIYSTHIDPTDPTNQIIVSDTIYLMKQMKINSTEINLGYL